MEYQGADAERFLAAVRGQLPFATSKAINDTAKDFQKAETEHIFSAFTVRREGFTKRSVKLTDRANKTKLWARVAMEDPGQVASSRSLFAKFESGGTKTGTTLQPVAIPSDNLRISPKTNIPRSMYPKALGLVARRGVKGILSAKTHVTSRGKIQIKGKRRTFVLGPPAVWGVYRRVNKEEIELLWTFKQRIPIPKRLSFVAIARKVVGDRFGPNFSLAFAFAVRTAR